MSMQLYIEDVSVGDELPQLTKDITNVGMFMYLAAIWLPDRIHFDYLYATQHRGLTDVVAPGTMRMDYYAQLLTDWAGEKGELRKLSHRPSKWLQPGDTVTCGGKIIGKSIKDGKGYVEFEMWVKNKEGINISPGKALVELPVRGGRK